MVLIYASFMRRLFALRKAGIVMSTATTRSGVALWSQKQITKTREERAAVLEPTDRLRSFVMSCPQLSTTGPQSTPLASGSFRPVARHYTAYTDPLSQANFPLVSLKKMHLAISTPTNILRNTSLVYLICRRKGGCRRYSTARRPVPIGSFSEAFSECASWRERCRVLGNGRHYRILEARRHVCSSVIINIQPCWMLKFVIICLLNSVSVLRLHLDHDTVSQTFSSHADSLGWLLGSKCSSRLKRLVGPSTRKSDA